LIPPDIEPTVGSAAERASEHGAGDWVMAGNQQETSINVGGQPIFKELRGYLFSAAGVIGGAITLLGNLQTAIEMSGWARWVVESWHEWTLAFWRRVLGWIGLSVPVDFVPILTFGVFALSLAIGARIATEPQGLVSPTAMISIKGLLKAFLSIGLFYAVIYGVAYVFSVLQIDPLDTKIAILSFVALMTLGPVVLIILFASYRLYALVITCIVAIFFVILTWPSLTATIDIFIFEVPNPASVGGAYCMLLVALLAMFVISPMQTLFKRLLLLAFCVVALLALNELSKLPLDVKPPKRVNIDRVTEEIPLYFTSV
jgi:hypothetical protein